MKKRLSPPGLQASDGCCRHPPAGRLPVLLLAACTAVAALALQNRPAAPKPDVIKYPAELYWRFEVPATLNVPPDLRTGSKDITIEYAGEASPRKVARISVEAEFFVKTDARGKRVIDSKTRLCVTMPGSGDEPVRPFRLTVTQGDTETLTDITFEFATSEEGPAPSNPRFCVSSQDLIHPMHWHFFLVEPVPRTSEDTQPRPGSP